jgi:hypothetical protein
MKWNAGKRVPNLICALFLGEFNSDVLLSFPNCFNVAAFSTYLLAVFTLWSCLASFWWWYIALHLLFCMFICRPDSLLDWLWRVVDSIKCLNRAHWNNLNGTYTDLLRRFDRGTTVTAALCSHFSGVWPHGFLLFFSFVHVIFWTHYVLSPSHRALASCSFITDIKQLMFIQIHELLYLDENFDKRRSEISGKYRFWLCSTCIINSCEVICGV